MARLPQVGGDPGNWGQILNEFLQTEHGSDGSLKIRDEIEQANYYSLPDGGIPASSLAASVQQNINNSQFFVNVKTFGAVGNGSNDDHSAIQSAISSLSASGGVVFFPAGTYAISQPIVINYDNITIAGTGASSTIQALNTALGINMVQIGDGVTTRAHCVVKDMRINANGQKTAGCGITLNKCFKIHLQNLLIEKQYRSLQFINTTEVWLSCSDVRDTQEHGLVIDNELYKGFDWYITDCVFDNPDVTNTGCGIYWNGGETLVVNGLDLLRFNKGLFVCPENDRESRFGFLNGLIADTSRDNNIHISNSGSGNAVGITFTNCWSGTAVNYGVLIDRPGSGIVQGIRWNAGKVFHNGLAGFRLAGGQDVHIAECDIIGNSQTVSAARHGVEVGGGISEFSVKGCRIGGGHQQGDTHGYAIHIDSGASDHYIITNNDCHGNNNTPKIDDNGTGVNKVVANNLVA